MVPSLRVNASSALRIVRPRVRTSSRSHASSCSGSPSGRWKWMTLWTAVPRSSSVAHPSIRHAAGFM